MIQINIYTHIVDSSLFCNEYIKMAVVFASMYALWMWWGSVPYDTNNTIQHVCIQSICFDTEVADDDQERSYGLMNRTYLPAYSGMLFVFEQAGPRSFWMKNTKIPLDIIWIDEKMKIIYIQHALPCTQDPCKGFWPMEDAKYVLEVNAWWAKREWWRTGMDAFFLP